MIQYSNYQTNIPSRLVDAFGRLRVSNPKTIFESKQIYDKQPLIWDDALVSGSGGASTFNTNNASTTLSVDNLTAAHRVRQTYQRFNYQPGKSPLHFLTGVLGSSNAGGVTKNFGLFDTNDGIFFSMRPNAAGAAVVLRSSTSGAPVDTVILQEDWNIDVFDGSGSINNPSKETIDFTKSQVFVFDYEWLGVGLIRFGFVVDGVLRYCHQIKHFNQLTSVYMSNPNLPIRCEIINTGTGSADSITHICATILIEGGQEDKGKPFGVTRGTTPLTTLNNTSIYPLIAIRLASNRTGAKVILNNISLLCTSNAAYNYYLMLNPVVTGTAFSFSAADANSVVEQDSSRTNATTVSGGTILFTDVLQNNSESVSVKVDLGDITLGTNIAGTQDIIVLGVQRVTGSTETFYGTINWKEII